GHKERAGFSGVHGAQLSGAFGQAGDVYGLTTAHPPRTGPFGEACALVGADGGAAARSVRCGAECEGFGLQGVSGQDGGRFIKSAVDGGLAASFIVVVHGGQIVVDEAVGVDPFEGAGGGMNALNCCFTADDLRDFDGQNGSNAFAPTGDGVFHGLQQV